MGDDIVEHLENAALAHAWEMDDDEISDLFERAADEIRRLREMTALNSKEQGQ